MHRPSDLVREDFPDVSPNALAYLNHAFRRKVSNRPTQRDRARTQQQRSTRRQFIETRSRKWKLDDRSS